MNGKEWRTAEDELVCKVCRPLDGARIAIEGNFQFQGVAPGLVTTDSSPPAHPGCRCYLAPVLEFKEPDVPIKEPPKPPPKPKPKTKPISKVAKFYGKKRSDSWAIESALEDLERFHNLPSGARLQIQQRSMSKGLHGRYTNSLKQIEINQIYSGESQYMCMFHEFGHFVDYTARAIPEAPEAYAELIDMIAQTKVGQAMIEGPAREEFFDHIFRSEVNYGVYFTSEKEVMARSYQAYTLYQLDPDYIDKVREDYFGLWKEYVTFTPEEIENVLIPAWDNYLTAKGLK